jgi:hypothetical protein
MGSFRVGGYHALVTVLDRDGVDVAHAACRVLAMKDYDTGEESWNGELRHVSPANVITAGPYRLRFPDGEVGEVTVRPPVGGGAFLYFAGVGPRPLRHSPLSEYADVPSSPVPAVPATR